MKAVSVYVWLWTIISSSPDTLSITLQECDEGTAEGTIRLTGGEDVFSGVVEVCHDPPGGVALRQWFSVCGDEDSWDNSTTNVVCTHLGFSEADAGASSVLNNTLNEDVLGCAGLERSTLNCSVTAECSQLAIVKCSPAQCRDGELRLRDGSTRYNGRVEICFHQQWGSVLDLTWGQEEADVACGQMGYSYSGAFPLFGFQLVDGTGPIYISRIQCNGSEARLTECLRDSAIQNRHELDAGVICSLAQCSGGDVRLVNGTTVIEGDPLSGRVEVCINQRWGSVCDDGWNGLNAYVICSQLGFSREGSIAVHQSAFGVPPIDPILVDDVQCTGDELNILGCPHRTSGHDCNHLETAGVVCQSIPPLASCVNNLVRLANGSQQGEGRVEICIDNHWSSVCDELWTEEDATVACRQLGFLEPGAVARRGAYFGRGSGAIFLSSLECSGSEEELVQCAVGAMRSCDHSLDVGVMCYVEPETPTPLSTDDLQAQTVSVVPWILFGICAAALGVLLMANMVCIIVITTVMRSRTAHRREQRVAAVRDRGGLQDQNSVHYATKMAELEMDLNPSYGQCTPQVHEREEDLEIVYEAI